MRAWSSVSMAGRTISSDASSTRARATRGRLVADAVAQRRGELRLAGRLRLATFAARISDTSPLLPATGPAIRVTGRAIPAIVRATPVIGLATRDTAQASRVIGQDTAAASFG